jgi:UDP-2,4-diacetamido-2,4,6-trideoxy-beta-L-altropyranose hydrolase
MKIRDAKLSDAELLFTWVNDNDVRENSFNQNPIQWENHVIWLIKKLSDHNVKIFILELDGLPVGQIRYELTENDKWIIDYSISKNYRGRGLGKQIISITIALFENGIFRGEVKSSNIASKKAFESNGFSKLDELKLNTNNIIIYEYKKN